MLTKYYDSMLKTPSLFDSFWILDELHGSSWPRSRSADADSCYRVNTTGSGLEISIDLPGVKKADLKVQATGRSIEVSGMLRGKEFKQTYKVSRDYDPDSIDAALEDGVLTIKLQRSEESATKLIDVK